MRVPYELGLDEQTARTTPLLRVALFGSTAQNLAKGGTSHLKLNTGERPIANKYREGKMKSSWERW